MPQHLVPTCMYIVSGYVTIQFVQFTPSSSDYHRLHHNTCRFIPLGDPPYGLPFGQVVSLVAQITHGNPLYVLGQPVTRGSAVPAPGSPTPAPTRHPTAQPTMQACANIINNLGPGDEICHADCDVTMPGTCTCAVNFNSFLGTCYHMCRETS